VEGSQPNFAKLIREGLRSVGHARFMVTTHFTATHFLPRGMAEIPRRW
jgi:hypothetical protein